MHFQWITWLSLVAVAVAVIILVAVVQAVFDRHRLFLCREKPN
jgi:hypothetical protein